MKRNNFLILFSFILLLVGCKSEEFSSINAEGGYAVNFSFPEGEVYAPAKVVLTNRSKNSESYQWYFKDGQSIDANGNVTPYTTSDKLTPDTVYYKMPGDYEITLVAQQNGKAETITKMLKVLKPSPEIVHPDNMQKENNIQFFAKAFSYEGVESTYSWRFVGNGIDTTSTEQNPVIYFAEGGIITATLTVNDGQETLTTTKQLRIAGELVKTLYFTDAITKRVYKYKFSTIETPTVEFTGITHGIHPFGMVVYGDRIYIGETGNNIAYALSANADGRIYSTSFDGTSETILSTATGNYQQDPFFLDVNPANGVLYFLTRSNNVRTIASTAVDVPYPTSAYVGVTPAEAGVSSVWGWTDGAVRVVGSELWYSKASGGLAKGLYKYDNATKVFKSAALVDYSIKNFVVDQRNNKIYFYINTRNRAGAIYSSDLAGTEASIQLIETLPNLSTEGGGTEIAGVNGMVIDEEAGVLYYNYRDASDVSEAGAIIGNGRNSGIKYYKLDGSMAAPEFLVKGYAPYGIAIDNTKRP